MVQLWRRDGLLLGDPATGRLTDCPECPCGEPGSGSASGSEGYRGSGGGGGGGGGSGGSGSGISGQYGMCGCRAMPRQVNLVVSGIGNTTVYHPDTNTFTVPCANCAGYNGTFLLTWTPNAQLPDGVGARAGMYLGAQLPDPCPGYNVPAWFQWAFYCNILDTRQLPGGWYVALGHGQQPNGTGGNYSCGPDLNCLGSPLNLSPFQYTVGFGAGFAATCNARTPDQGGPATLNVFPA